MKTEEDDFPFKAIIREKYFKLYKEMKSKGLAYFEPGFELYYLSMAYTIMIYYTNEEKYEECCLIRDLIDDFMRKQPGAAQISIMKMIKNDEELFRKHPHLKNRRKP